MSKRKNIKKALASLLLTGCLLFTLLLSGCHGAQGRTAFAVPETFDESRTYEISFWAKNDTNKTQVKIYEDAIAAFEALYPNIHVTMHRYTDYGKIYNDVITNIATDTTPNVCITYPDHIATYLTGAEVVVPLDDLFTDSRYGLGGSELKFEAPTEEEIIPEYLQECIVGGYYYAVPFMRSTEACYVNKTYVEKLGFTLPETLTWDFVYEVSEAAMEKNADGTYKVNGQTTMIPFIYKSTDNMMIQLLRQQNAGYSTDAGEILLFNDTTRDTLKTIASHAATGAFNTFKKVGYPANFLNAGQCIFAVDSTAGATWMGSDAPLADIPADKFVQFETAVLPVPQVDTEHPQMISQGPSVCIFNKEDPQEVLASWLFTEFLLTDAVQTAYAQTEGYVPVTKRAQTSAAYTEYLSLAGTDTDAHYDIKIQASGLLMAHTADTFTTAVFNGSTSLRDAAGEMIEKVNTAVRRKQTVDDAYIDELFESVSSLYRLDQITTSEAESTDKDLGPLPAGSKALLISLAAVWLLLGAGTLAARVRKKKKR